MRLIWVSKAAFYQIQAFQKHDQSSSDKLLTAASTVNAEVTMKVLLGRRRINWGTLKFSSRTSDSESMFGSLPRLGPDHSFSFQV